MKTSYFTTNGRSYEVPAYNIVSRGQDRQDTTFYRETSFLGARYAMSSKTRELGTATLGGLVVGSVVTSVLGIGASFFPDILASFYPAIGAFVGGMVAAYLLRGKTGQAAGVGALSGILGIPFFLGLSDVLAIFSLMPTSSGPTPSLADLQAAVAIISGMDLVAGAIGGLVLSSVYHAPAEPTPVQPQMPAGTGPAQPKYCVQCGAQLSAGVLICPHCGARQPQ